MKKSFRNGTVILALILLVSAIIVACGNVEEAGRDFQLINNGSPALIYVEGTNAPALAGDTGEYPGVTRASYDLQSDIEAITGKKPIITKSIQGYAEYMIIIGTIGRSDAIDRIIENGKLDVSEVEGKWESYIIKNVNDPFGDGRVKTALVVAGADKRGSIYGIYEISEIVGMSPWHFFADSHPGHKDNVVFERGFTKIGKEPDVQYRGIFINDEEDLELWGRSLDNGKHMGPILYEKIFEMLLRVKANYLWPGMHACSDAFVDYAENPINADYYGIVVGTSHCDMLLRNNINEWTQFVSWYNSSENPDKQDTEVEYDYTVSPHAMQEYWRQSVRANKDYEVQWTLGIRGKHDDPPEMKYLARDYENNPNLLIEEVIRVQRQILRDELKNPTLENVFMMFVPYKEVQTYYNNGVQIPEDITIMWADDNHGFIRNMPNETERQRSGGHGVYYHNSYWGPDNESYMWTNSMPFTLIYEEMNKAYAYGATKAWILNSGDTVPYLPNIEFFMSLGYDMSQYNHENVYEQYFSKVAKREFGEEFSSELAEIYKMYSQMTNVRKIEHMYDDIFSASYGDENERRAAQYLELYERAEALNQKIPEQQQGCFYQIMLFEIRCAYYTNIEYYYSHKSLIAANQGRTASAHNSAVKSTEFNQYRKNEISYYNNVYADGKYKNLMDPEIYVPPTMQGAANSAPAFKTGAPSMGVIAEGEQTVQSSSTLYFYNYAQGRKFIDIFNKGAGTFDYTISTDKSYVLLSKSSGTVSDEQRVWVSVDFGAVSASEDVIVTIESETATKTITIKIVKDSLSLGEKTYVEQDGYVSIEAEHYSSARTTNVASWNIIKDLGRVSGDMVRAETKTLVGYNEKSFKTNAPYLEYNIYFKNTGVFEAELYRLPTLSALGHVRLGVTVGDSEPIIIEGENDYGTNNPLWEEGIFTQIIKHKLSLEIENEGLNKIRIYMIDPFVTVDKMVIYTEEKQASYFGPLESYNTTFNLQPWEKASYEDYYESEYVLPEDYDIARSYGTGAFVENSGKVFINAASAALDTDGVNYSAQRGNSGTDGVGIRGRWITSQTYEGIIMRTANLRVDYDGLWEPEAPRMDYDVYFTTPGTYSIWVYVKAVSARTNAWAIGWNGAQKSVQLAQSWDTDKIFNWKKASATLTVSSAGMQTINYYCSQDGITVDKIYLTTGSETPNALTFNATFTASARSPISATDGVQRQKLLTALNALGNFYNIPAGEAVGDYNTEYVEALKLKIDDAYNMLNSKLALNSDNVDTAIDALNSALTNMIASRNMSDDANEYFLHESYEKAYAGLSPFGYAIDSIARSPYMNIRNASDGSKYLNIRTFAEQKNQQRAMLSYSYGNLRNTAVVFESRMSFNEADWGYAMYIRNDMGAEAISIAFEFYNNKYSIIAYDAGVKKTVGSYERNVMVDFKIIANVEAGTYDLYLNGEKAVSGFRFRTMSEFLSTVMFGSQARDADLRIEYIKGYTVKA